MEIQFKQWKCELQYANYHDGKLAILLLDPETNQTIAKATTNLAGEEMEYDEVVIKDYSENAGMLETLVNAGVVEHPHRYVKSGFVTFPVCRVTNHPLDNLEN